MEDKQRCIRVRIAESRGQQKVAQLIVPNPGRLFKPINGFVEFANKGGFVLINKPRWLRHEHSFREAALKKGIVDVQLFKRPSMTDSKTKY